MSLYAQEAWLRSGGVEDADCRAWLLGGERGALLDVGCSAGEAAADWAAAGCAVTGVDIVEEAVALARSRCPAGAFLLADAAALPFEDASFDIVHMGCMREPLRESGLWERACREARRVLRTNGLLLWGDLGPAPTLEGFLSCRQRDATDALKAFNAKWIWNNDAPFPFCGEARSYTLAVYQKR